MSERLEEIKHRLHHLSLIDRDEEVLSKLNIITVQEDLEYLVQQAELVNKLTKSYNDHLINGTKQEVNEFIYAFKRVVIEHHLGSKREGERND